MFVNKPEAAKENKNNFGNCLVRTFFRLRFLDVVDSVIILALYVFFVYFSSYTFRMQPQRIQIDSFPVPKNQAILSLTVKYRRMWSKSFFFCYINRTINMTLNSVSKSVSIAQLSVLAVFLISLSEISKQSHFKHIINAS